MRLPGDVSRHLPGDFADKGVYLLCRTFHETFHSPVRHVFDMSCYIIAASYTAGGKPKTHPLDSSEKVNDSLFVGHIRITAVIVSCPKLLYNHFCGETFFG